MNKLQKYGFVLICMLTLYGCGDKISDPVITSLELTVSKSRILGDNIDYASVSVLDQDGRDAKGYVNIYTNGEIFKGDNIKSSTPSPITVYAQYNNIKSNEKVVEVVEDKNLKFEKNILIEQYTGTWCGWCPRAVNQINILGNVDKKIIHSALHLSDEFAFSLNSTLFQSFGFTGVPTVHADRNVVWSGSSSELDWLRAPSRIGMSLEVTGNVNEIEAKVKVRFGYQFNNGLKLSVYLLHDSLAADQINYYNTDPSSPYYHKGSPMVGFIHRNVLLKAGTNMFGDAIAADSVGIGSNYSKSIHFTSFRCDDLRRIRVIALVTYQNGEQAGKVGNSIGARVGEKKDFVFAPK